MNAEVKEQDSPAPSAERTEASQEISAAGEQPDKPKTEANGDGTANGASANGQKPNPKDPSRPRRKKARRACFACQRAHLTCGTTDLTFPALLAFDPFFSPITHAFSAHTGALLAAHIFCVSN